MNQAMGWKKGDVFQAWKTRNDGMLIEEACQEENEFVGEARGGQTHCVVTEGQPQEDACAWHLGLLQGPGGRAACRPL